MPVRGDFSGLEDLRRRLAAIGDGKLRQDVNKVCAEAAVKVLDDEFRSSTDPYGNPWTPLKSRTGQPLRDTGAHLQNTLTPKATSTGFVVATSFVGAAVHQYGATIRAKTSKGLRFRTRGAPTKSNKRGKLSNWITKQEVTIPRRQYMPEGEIGPRWSDGLGNAATRAIWDAMGKDY